MKLIKLLLGTIFFITLCGSGMMLTVLLLGFLEGHNNARALASLLISIGVFFTSSVFLYYLSREKTTDLTSETSKKFKFRKLKFQLLVIALITVFIIAIPFIADSTNYVRLAAALISTLFFGLYIMLARKLWRCPACESQLPFMSQRNDRQSIKICPSCATQLQ
jgi:uncharacterized membrane protein